MNERQKIPLPIDLNEEYDEWAILDAPKRHPEWFYAPIGTVPRPYTEESCFSMNPGQPTKGSENLLASQDPLQTESA